MRLAALVFLIALACGTKSASPGSRPADKEPVEARLGDCDLPGRTYASRDADACVATRWSCPTGHGTFEDACGCGCIAPGQ